MLTFPQIKQFLKRDLQTVDLNSAGFAPRLIIRTLRLTIAVTMEFRHRLLDARAAGLVYTTLLSLVPFLAVMFSVLKAFGVHHQIEPVLANVLEPLGPKGKDITAQLIGFVDNLKVGVLGTVGVAGLFYTTYSLIDKIEQALNAIWRVRQGRSWTRKFTDYLSVVLVGPLLIVTAVGLLASFQSQTVVRRVLEIQPLGPLAVGIAKFGPFLLLAAVFAFFYKFIPNTRVEIKSALVGGITSAVLWGVTGALFAKFVAGSAKYGAIYSSFAILILFLLWLYAGWLIMLVGAQVAFFHQHPNAYLSKLTSQQGTFAFRERMALMMMAALTRRFLNGEGPVRASELAGELDFPVSLIEEHIDHFITHGFLGRMKEPEGVVLVKPPESTSIEEVLDAVRESGPPESARSGPLNPVEQALSRRDQAVRDSLAGLTLRSLVPGQQYKPKKHA
jgi:membrane protein